MGLVARYKFKDSFYNDKNIYNATAPTNYAFVPTGKIGRCIHINSVVETNIPYSEWSPSYTSVSFGGWVKFNFNEVNNVLQQYTYENYCVGGTGNLFGYNRYQGFAICWISNNMIESNKVFNYLQIFLNVRENAQAPNQPNAIIKDTASFYIGPGRDVEFDEWFHVFCTYNKDTYTMQLFLNGKLYSEISFPPYNFSEAFIDQPFKINAPFIYGGSGPAMELPMSINDVQIYNECLSSKEINNIYKLCVLDYNFNDPFVEPTKNLGNTSATYSNRNENQEYQLQSWGGDAGTVTFHYSGGYNNYPYKRYHKTHSGTGGSYAITKHDINLEAGKTYTMSIYIRASMEFTDISHSFNINRATDNYYITYNTDVHFTTQWQRISKTFTTTDAQAGVYGEMSILYNDTVEDYWVEYSGFQIEENDHVTPFVNGERLSDNIISDTSGYKHDGLINGDFSFIEDDTSIGGYSFKTNGCTISTDKIFYDNVNQCHTVSCWVKPTEMTYDSTIVNFNYYYKINHATTGRTICYLNSGANDSYVYGSPIPLNEWTLITWLIDKQNVINKVYYNGVLDASSGNFTSNDVPYGFADQTIFLQNFKGYIGSIKIYATILSDEDIKDEYESRAYITNNQKMIANSFHENNDINIQKNYVVSSSEIVEPSTLLESCIPTKALDDGTQWARIFYHNNKSGTVLFSNKTEALHCSETDKFSRLDLLNDDFNLLNSHMEYEFMLDYPTDNNIKYNRWKQTSNPCQTNQVLGYVPIHIDYTAHNWMGLAISSNPGSTFLDGAASGWYYAIGSYGSYNNGIPNDIDSTLNDVELWIRIDNTSTASADTISNTLIHKSGVLSSDEFIEE